jgi:hypothetical protein
MTNGPGLFFWRRFFGALPEFFCGWAESAFCSDDADGFLSAF